MHVLQPADFELLMSEFPRVRQALTVVARLRKNRSAPLSNAAPSPSARQRRQSSVFWETMNSLTEADVLSYSRYESQHHVFARRKSIDQNISGGGQMQAHRANSNAGSHADAAAAAAAACAEAAAQARKNSVVGRLSRLRDSKFGGSMTGLRRPSNFLRGSKVGPAGA